MTNHLVSKRSTRVAAALVGSVVVLMATLMTPVASAGKTGDTKLLQGGVPVSSNDPHLTGCQFTIVWSDFSTATVTYRLEGSPPSGTAVIGGGVVTLDASGNGTAPITFNAANLAPLTASSQGYHITLIGDSTDPNANGKNKTFWVEKYCAANVGLDKTSNKTTVLKDAEQVIFNVVTTNTSVVATDDLVVIDTLPAELTYVSSTNTAGSCTNVGQVVTCPIGVLAALTGTATVTVTATGNTVGGPWSNSATVYKNDVARSQADSDTSNNTDTATVSVTAPRTWSISGIKTEDTNGDGTAAGDSNKVGWNIHLVADANGNGVYNAGETVTTQATGAGGAYSFSGLTDGADYLVCEDSGGAGWTQLGPTAGATCTSAGYAAKGYNFQNLGANQTNKDFWNQPPVVLTWSISGIKTEDTNRDGTAAGDSNKVGWNIHLVADANGNGVYNAGETVTTQATGAGGAYSFSGLTDGADYLVCEDNGGAGWTQLGPTAGATCTSAGYATNGYNFQNLSVNQTGKDFWNQPPATDGTLIIDKVATGAGASQSEPFAFTDNIPAQVVGNVQADTNETYTVRAGTYSVTEDALSAAQTAAGWTKGAATCSDGSLVTAIDISVGETVTCTYNNSFVAPPTDGILIIDKVATGTNASQTEPFAFTDSIPNQAVGNVQADTNETYTVLAGTYSVTEDALSAAQIAAGWTQGAATCSDGSPATAISISVGETVTCTYNNSFAAPPIQPPTPLPNLAVTKTGTPSSIPVGGTATYTLTVTNNGAGAASNVVLTDSMPAGLAFVSSTPGAPTCTNVHDALANTDTVTCQLGSLAPGASSTVTVIATGVSPGTYTNTAVVGPSDPDPTDNTDTAETVVTPVADLMITKDIDLPVVPIGQQVTYTLTTTNNGPSAATGVVVTDTLPAELTFVSSDGACTGTTTITCTIGDMAAGEVVVIHIVVETTEPGTFTNGVEVLSTTADPDLSNNSDTVDVGVEADEVLGKVIHNAEPKPEVAAERQNVLPFTGLDARNLGGIAVVTLLLGGLLLLLDLRKRRSNV